jgi:hypothetical protein
MDKPERCRCAEMTDVKDKGEKPKAPQGWGWFFLSKTMLEVMLGLPEGVKVIDVRNDMESIEKGCVKVKVNGPGLPEIPAGELIPQVEVVSEQKIIESRFETVSVPNSRWSGI